MHLSTASASSFVLDKRQCDRYDRFGRCIDYSAWDNWGRYVVLAGVILVAVVLFLIMACITARKRRSRGAQPYYGTGWMGGHGNVNYYPQQPYGNQQYGQQSYAQPAPPYTTTGASQDYYGNAAPGIELQQPQSSYQPQAGGDPVYSPPTGPPPGKKGDIVR